MSQTLVNLIVHLVFSTKHRVNIITPEIEPELFSYIGGILRKLESRLMCAGGTSDHVHLLVSQSKNIALSRLLQDLKADSSKWIKTQGTEFSEFHWQDGYGAFSVSSSDLLPVKKYIKNQKEHHRKETFQEELIRLFQEHGIEYDERYLWS